MSIATEIQSTVDDLLRVKGKAELIGGRIITLMTTGRKPNRVAGRIFKSLDNWVEEHHLGEAYTDNIGFIVEELTSGRQSFSPDVSFHPGPFGSNPMRFVEGAPVFAVEVRSENDYGNAAEEALALKRADYFEAGTQIVWDVDPEAEVIRIYRQDTPDLPRVCIMGDSGDCQGVLPGWFLEVERVFG
jgi:Uma2 family endonuclease